MKATELRIGNWVSFLIKGTPIFVQSKVASVAETRLRLESDPLTFYDIEGNIQPIPITEEWLLKMGFQKSDSGRMYLNDDFYFENGQLWIGAPDGQFWRYVMAQGNYDYIHQLQNLYFALTGEELIVKD